MSKSRDAFRTISEVADHLELPQHVLRFWETKFSQIKPMKRGGNRRYYRPDDVNLLITIRQLLHEDGLTIRGAQKLFKDQGVKSVVENCLAGNLPGGLQAEEARRASEKDAKANADDAPETDQVEETVEAKPVQNADAPTLTAVHEQLMALRRMISA